MNHPHDDSDPVEHDPTGMRALLGSLPDPGPMPDDLVSRISAALEHEAQRADAWAVPAGADELSAARLRRRRLLRGLGAAAAVIGVLGVGGLVVETTSPGGLQATLGLAGSGSSGAGSASDAMAPAGAENATGARVLAADPALRVRVLTGGPGITSDGLAAHAAELPTEADESAVGPRSAPAASGEPVAAPAGARDCATGLGVPRTDDVLVQLVPVDGSPAAVLVATSSSGSRTAWAVTPTCTATDPGVLAGPVPVP